MIQTVSAIENWFLNVTLKVQFSQCFLTMFVYNNWQFSKTKNYVNIINELKNLSKSKFITFIVIGKQINF